MYTLKEAYSITSPDKLQNLYGERFACGMSNAAGTSKTNLLNEAVACYTFTLVLRGEMTLESNGHIIPFKTNDLFVYQPGLQPFRVLSVSDDYLSNVLIVDEQTTYETKAFRNLLRVTSYPLIQYGTPRLALAADDAQRLNADMRSIQDHIHHPTRHSDETLDMLYSVFLLDMIDIQEHSETQHRVPRRSEDLFITFYALMRKHFVEQHGISFYADRLNVTPTYLSRIVKTLTGHTVMECINQMLATEAIWLLTSTDLTISQIADRLHFATTASFDKFFQRICRKAPKDYRKR